MLLDAAWHAYVEDDDPNAAKDYALRADEYAIPENAMAQVVTRNRVIVDNELAQMNGNCRGISGELEH